MDVSRAVWRACVGGDPACRGWPGGWPVDLRGKSRDQADPCSNGITLKPPPGSQVQRLLCGGGGVSLVLRWPLHTRCSSDSAQPQPDLAKPSSHFTGPPFYIFFWSWGGFFCFFFRCRPGVGLSYHDPSWLCEQKLTSHLLDQRDSAAYYILGSDSDSGFWSWLVLVESVYGIVPHSLFVEGR